MAVEIFHEALLGSNARPLDQQSDTLSIVLQGPIWYCSYMYVETGRSPLG